MDAEETTTDEPKPDPEPDNSGSELITQSSGVARAALVKVGERGIELRTMDDLFCLAKTLVASGAAPKGMNTAAVVIAMEAGMKRGLDAMAAVRALVIVNGNLTWRGEAAFGHILKSPLCVPGTLAKFIEGTGDDMMGVAVGQRVGYKSPVRREFSVADAKTAKLWGKSGRNGDPTPWVLYPKRMLMWRAFGDLAKDVFPDVLGGFATDVEAQDYTTIETTRGETPASRVAAGLAPAPGADPLAAILEGEVVDVSEIPEGMR